MRSAPCLTYSASKEAANSVSATCRIGDEVRSQMGDSLSNFPFQNQSIPIVKCPPSFVPQT